MQAFLGRGIPRKQPPEPRERDRGRLVSGQEQRQRLVAHLRVRHAGPVLPRSEQERQQVVAREAGCAALDDHLSDHAVQVGLEPVVPAHRGRGQPHQEPEQRRVHAIEHPEIRRRKDVDNGAAGDERGGFLGRQILFEDAEAAGPPFALQVDVRTIGEQQVEQCEIPGCSRDRPALEVTDRLVDSRPHVGVLLEEPCDAIDIAGVESADELLEGWFRRRHAAPC